MQKYLYFCILFKYIEKMRKIAANYIFPVNESPIKNGILTISENGEILNISQLETNSEMENIEFYNGVLVPGFINGHCHLELSYAKGKIKSIQGLADFLAQFVKVRNKAKNLTKNMLEADLEMQREGIVAVADISNTSESFVFKANSKIKYYTFIELLSIVPNAAQGLMERANQLRASYFQLFEQQKRTPFCSIAPHAPYSVSKKLFGMIKEFLFHENEILCIHNQENESENEMFISKTGALLDLFVNFNIDISSFESTGNTSFTSYSNEFAFAKQKLFVHNIYTSEQDINFAQRNFSNSFWVICPFSNLFIENKLADLDIFLKNNQKLVFGTDSLASNEKLSIIEEMKIIRKYYPQIAFNEMLEWATINGATALGFDKSLGSFEIGKTPGINLIKNFDFEQMNIKSDSKVIVLQ